MDFEDFLALDPKKISGTLSVICGNQIKRQVEGNALEMRRMVLSNMGESYLEMPWDEFTKFINDSFLFDFKQIFKGRINKEDEDETLELRAWIDESTGVLLLATGMDNLKELILHMQVETEESMGFPWSGGRINESEPILHLHTNTHEGLSYWLIKASFMARPILPWQSGDEIPWCYVPGIGRPMDVKLFDLIFRDVDEESRDIYKVVREDRN